MPDGPLIGIDIEAIQTAVEALDDAGIDVQDVDDIRNEDGKVRWTMTAEAETRTADLDDFK